MLGEQYPDAVLTLPSDDLVLRHGAPRAETSSTPDAAIYRQGSTARDVSPAHRSDESNGAEKTDIGAPLSEDVLTAVQGGISGAGIGGLAGGALGVAGVGVLAVGSGIIAVASAPVLIAAGVVGGVTAGIGAGVGALVDCIKGD